MTSLTTAVSKMNRTLELLNKSKTDTIPPEIVVETCAVIYIPWVQSGKQKPGRHKGLFMIKKPDGNWSWPIALQVDEGVIETNSDYVDIGDCFIIMNDKAAVEHLMNVNSILFGGQFGSFLVSGGLFSTRTYKLHSVPTSYSYYVSGTRISASDVLTCGFSFRDSSNHKYYSSRNATCHNIFNDHVDLKIHDPESEMELTKLLSNLEVFTTRGEAHLDTEHQAKKTDFKEMTMDDVESSQVLRQTSFQF